MRRSALRGRSWACRPLRCRPVSGRRACRWARSLSVQRMAMSRCSIWRSGSSNAPGGRLRLRPFRRSKGARSEREAAEDARLHAVAARARPSKLSAPIAGLKPDGKSGFRNQAAYRQLPFVSSSDFLADSQSQARTVVTAIRSTPVPLEKERKVVLVDARPLVLNLNRGLVDDQRYDAIGWRSIDRILDNILEQDKQRAPVCPDRRRRNRHLKLKLHLPPVSLA